MPIVLGAFFVANPWPLTLLAAMAAFIGGREIAGMLGRACIWGGILAAGLVLAMAIMPIDGRVVLVPWVIGSAAVGVLFSYLAAAKRIPTILPLAVLWVASPLVCILFGKPVVSGGALWEVRVPILLAILPLWGGDTAAIFAGKAFGRHLLAPNISPKKTWEGAIANLISCLLVAWLFGQLLGAALVPSLLCGMAAGTLGQAGDLFESYVKRQSGLKDSGNLLPGHGGLMDRIDSILFTAPAVALILWLTS
jgi:phosphatidate cytidylyltransferase